MNPIRFFKTAMCFLVAALACTSFPAAAGGIAGTVGPIDYETMQGYAPDMAGEPQSERDPFTTSDKMFRASGQQNAGGGRGFVPFATGNIPRMRVRGFVRNDGETMALLQIEGEDTVHLVRAGDEVGVQTRNNGINTVLKVLTVDSKKVEVQSGSLRQVIIVQ